MVSEANGRMSGWQLLPVEPTDEMLDAGKREAHRANGAREKALRMFKAMAAAAPTAPAAPDAQRYQPCKGMNCGTTDGRNHSPECQAEHADAIAGGRFVNDAQQGQGELLKAASQCEGMARRLYNEPIGSVPASDVGAVLQYAGQLLALAARSLPTVACGLVPDGFALVLVDRSYDQRVKALVAFNQCTGDLDDKLGASWMASIAASPAPARAQQPAGQEGGAA